MKQAVTRVWSRYAVFTGRASRPEFWWWVLFVFILMALSRALDAWIVVPALGIIPGPGGSAQPLSALVSLVLLLPAIGVAVRRLHDSNRSGWWFLLVLIPVIGSLVLIYFYVQPSDKGRNGYGEPDPLPEE